jgi:hypothetical protein
VFFPDLPIYSSCFINQGTILYLNIVAMFLLYCIVFVAGEEVLCSGRRKFLWSFNLDRGTTTRITPKIGQRQQKSNSCCVCVELKNDDAYFYR